MTQQRMIDIFCEEFEEIYDRALQSLLGLGNDTLPDTARTQHLLDLKALLHGLKGSAMFIEGCADISTLSHALEDLLKHAPSLQNINVNFILATLEACHQIVSAVQRGEPSPIDPAPILRAIRAASPETTPPHAEPEPLLPTPDRSVERVATTETLRVSVEHIDDLTRNVSRLSAWNADFKAHTDTVDGLLSCVTAAARSTAHPETQRNLLDLRRQLETLSRTLRRDSARLNRLVAENHANVSRLRLQHFSTLFDRLRLAFKDVTQRSNKPAELHLDGGDLLLDKRAIEILRVALLHLIRNAVDHGLETSASRAAAHKPPQGVIRVSASKKAGQLQISVRDDGQGVDEIKLRARAQELGIENANTLSLLDLMSRDGLSSRTEANEISGRGVGVAAVIEEVHAIGGHVRLESTQGQGTCFFLTLPASLATRECLRVTLQGSPFYILSSCVDRVLRLRAEDLRFFDGQTAILIHDNPTPLLALEQALSIQVPPSKLLSDSRAVLSLSTPEGQRAISVDVVLSRTETFVTPLSFPIVNVPWLKGCVVEGEGVAVPVLDLLALLSLKTHTPNPSPSAATAGERAHSVLVVDDSASIRTLERDVLRGAGLRVSVASNGDEALKMLASSGPFDLIVSDIEMPILDGLGLLKAVRQEHSRAALPIILVTSVEDEKIRAHAMSSGANALIQKQTFDPERLLSTIRAVLAQSSTP